MVRLRPDRQLHLCEGEGGRWRLQSTATARTRTMATVLLREQPAQRASCLQLPFKVPVGRRSRYVPMWQDDFGQLDGSLLVHVTKNDGADGGCAESCSTTSSTTLCPTPPIREGLLQQWPHLLGWSQGQLLKQVRAYRLRGLSMRLMMDCRRCPRFPGTAAADDPGYPSVATVSACCPCQRRSCPKKGAFALAGSTLSFDTHDDRGDRLPQDGAFQRVAHDDPGCPPLPVARDGRSASGTIASISGDEAYRLDSRAHRHHRSAPSKRCGPLSMARLRLWQLDPEGWSVRHPQSRR